MVLNFFWPNGLSKGRQNGPPLHRLRGPSKNSRHVPPSISKCTKTPQGATSMILSLIKSVSLLTLGLHQDRGGQVHHPMLVNVVDWSPKVVRREAPSAASDMKWMKAFSSLLKAEK